MWLRLTQYGSDEHLLVNMRKVQVVQLLAGGTILVFPDSKTITVEETIDQIEQLLEQVFAVEEATSSPPETEETSA